MNSIKIGDIFIIIAVFALVIVFQVTLLNQEVFGDDRYITLVVDDQVHTYVYDIHQEDTIEFKFGDHTGYMIYEKGRVRIERMTLEECPNQICSRTGWIEKKNQSIVCMPNKIMVTIEGREEVEMDIISY